MPKRIHLYLCFTFVFFGFTSLLTAQGLIKIISDQNLFNALASEIQQYRADLEAEGYSVSFTSGTFSDPAAVRKLLQDQKNNGLVGAVLIGDIPLARFNRVENLHQSYRHDFYTPLYFMDLDGSWGGEERGVFTSHGGKKGADIWVGFIRAGNLPAAGDEITLLKKYFTKIHNYRLRKHYLPPFRSFRLYHTIKPNYQNLNGIYNDITDPGCQTSASQLREFLNDPNGYDFAVINTASGSSVHHFHQQPCWPLSNSYWTTNHNNGDKDANCSDKRIRCSGDCDIDYNDVVSTNPRILFYHLATSETGRFDAKNNLSGHYVFGSDYGLAALAATQHTILGDYFYEPLKDGKSFGEAYKTDMNRFLIDLEAGRNTSTEWCPDWDEDFGDEPLTETFYAGILIGDPTLKIDFGKRTDTLPPVFSNIKATNITGTTVTITWNTDEAATSSVEYGESKSYGSNSPVKPAPVTDHSVTITGLKSEVTYHFRVQSTDALGNTATSENQTFTTIDDTSPPQLTNVVVSDITSISARISWSTNEPARSEVTYGLTTNYDQKSDGGEDVVTEHSVVLQNLLANRTYNLKAVSTDGSDNTGRSNNITFKTDEDFQAPVIENAEVSAVTTTGFDVAWTTNEPTLSRVEYGLSSILGSKTPLSLEYSSANKVTIKDLKHRSTYYYRVYAIDSGQNVTVSETKKVVTLTDDVGPELSNITAINAINNSVTISWETNEPADARIEYGASDAYGSTSDLNTAFETSQAITLQNLPPDQVIHYRIHAKDVAGNLTISEDLTFKTPEDNVGPSLTRIAIKELSHHSAKISWQTDEPSTAKVEYGTALPYDELQSSNEFRVMHEIILPDLKNGSFHNFRISSSDISGNESRTPNAFFNTRVKTPTFSQVIEAETMPVQTAGSSAESDTVWNLNSTGRIAASIDFPSSETYLFFIRMKSSEAITYPVQIVLQIDQSTQNTFLVSADEYGFFTTRTFLGAGTHEIALMRPVGAPLTSDLSIDWIQVQSTSEDQDVSPPVISGMQVEDISDNSAVIRWQTDERATSSFSYGTDASVLNVTIDDPVLSAMHKVELSGLDYAQQYFFRIVHTDADGNRVESEIMSFTAGGDNEGSPILRGIAVQSITANTAVITWRTNIASTSTVEYGLDANYGLSSQQENLQTVHSIGLTGLEPLTKYYFRVRSTREESKETVSDDLTFKTLAAAGQLNFNVRTEAENMPIRTAGNAVEAGTAWMLSTAGITADSIDFPVNGTYFFKLRARGVSAEGTWPLVDFRLNGSAFSRVSINSDTYAEYTAQLDIIEGKHEIALVLINPVNTDRVVWLDWLEVTASAILDITSPQTSNIVTTFIPEDKMQVQWQTNEPANGLIEYGLTSALGQTSVTSAPRGIAHVVTLQQLQKGQQYYYQIKSWDAYGNVSITPQTTFRTDTETGVSSRESTPAHYTLSNAYPNPFRTVSYFKVAVPGPGLLTAIVYNIKGQVVARLLESHPASGEIRIQWNGLQGETKRPVSNGVYLLRTTFKGSQGKSQVLTKKVILAR